MNETHAANVSWRLRDADTSLRLFVTAFLLLLTIGYVIGLAFVDHTSSGTRQGLVEEYRGTPENAPSAELKYAKSPDEMYIFLHNHILSLALVFFAVGGIFYFTSTPSGFFKDFLIIEPFIGIATTFGGLWLMRYVSGQFSWLVLISGVSMACCYLLMVLLILKELWIRR
jgi:hypothetical protein